MSVLIPEPVRRKAEHGGFQWWIDALPDVVQRLVHDWDLAIEDWYDSGTEAVVAKAIMRDGTPAALKIILPQTDAAPNEIRALTLAEGGGLAKVFRFDVARGAVLLERLGPNLASMHLPFLRTQEILADLASTVWRPVPAGEFPNGREKAVGLRRFVESYARRLPDALSPAAVAYAVACSHRRERAYNESAAVLCHGDVHAWNALARLNSRSTTGSNTDQFALVDPDGLFIEPEYDLGVILREDPHEGDPYDRAQWLAERTGTNADAIFEWGVIERTTTGLLLCSIGMDDVGRPMLELADSIAMRRAG